MILEEDNSVADLRGRLIRALKSVDLRDYRGEPLGPDAVIARAVSAVGGVLAAEGVGALPPGDGERARALEAIDHATCILRDRSVVGIAVHALPGSAHLRAISVIVADLRTAAALLRQQVQMRGVSKEEVLHLIRQTARDLDELDGSQLPTGKAMARLFSAVDTLPEAAPRESPEDERERQRLADVVESVGKRGLSPWQEEDMKKASELLRRRGRIIALLDPDSPEALWTGLAPAAPPSGVDREAAIEQLADLLNNEACSCAGTPDHPCPRCIVSIDQSRELLAKVGWDEELGAVRNTEGTGKED